MYGRGRRGRGKRESRGDWEGRQNPANPLRGPPQRPPRHRQRRRRPRDPPRGPPRRSNRPSLNRPTTQRACRPSQRRPTSRQQRRRDRARRGPGQRGTGWRRRRTRPVRSGHGRGRGQDPVPEVRTTATAQLATGISVHGPLPRCHPRLQRQEIAYRGVGESRGEDAQVGLERRARRERTPAEDGPVPRREGRDLGGHRAARARSLRHGARDGAGRDQARRE